MANQPDYQAAIEMNENHDDMECDSDEEGDIQHTTDEESEDEEEIEE